MTTDPAPRPCVADPCRSYATGHVMHHIQARLTGESPWGWRDATVVAVEERWLHLAYTLEPGTPQVWHHKPVAPLLPVGTPVRVHERFHVLGSAVGWLNVVVSNGVGAVPVPDDPELWIAERTPGVVDLSTGFGLPLDHESSARASEGDR